MRRWDLPTIAVILVALSCTWCGVALGAEVAVCTLTSDQTGPDVSGDHVVWEDHRGGVSRIYLYTISSGKTTLVPPPVARSNQYEPAISGDSVVFVSQSTAGYEIRLYSIAGRTSVAVRNGTNRLESPDVQATSDGVTVVWTEYVQNDPYGAPNSEIWLHTRSSGIGFTRTVQLSSGGYESDPRISGRDVVWVHKAEVPGLDSYHGPYDVYAATTDGTARLISTTTEGERNLFPDVSAGRVVWQAHPGIDGYGSRVLLAGLPPTVRSPGTLRPRADETPAATTVCRQPSISGDTVVYVASDLSAGGDRLMVIDPGTDLDYSLSTSTAVASPRVDGQTVVWQDRRAGNWDIYLASTAPVPVTGCTVITDPGYYRLEADIIDSTCPIAIRIQAPDVLLDGRGHLVDGIDGAETCGIRIIGGTAEVSAVPVTNVNVENVRLADWHYGLSAFLCSNSTFSRISASNGTLGVLFDPECRSDTLLSCSITDNEQDGLSVFTYSSVHLANCTIARNGGNGVSGSISGVHCRDGLVAGNGGDGLFFDRAGCTLHNTTIRDNAESGIEFYHEESVYCTIEGNTITGNAVGISDVNYYGIGRTIYNNHFNNTVNADSDAMNAWSVAATSGPNIVGGPSIGGNYWAQPDGLGFSETHPDLDSDGFCDEEYVITTADEGFTESIDHLPLRRPADPANPVPLPNVPNPPQDLHLDGRYEDVNGNGRADFADVVLYFNQMGWIAANEPLSAFDYNGNGRIDFADVVWLFNAL